MIMPGSVRSIATAAVAMSLATSSIASAAPVVSGPANPLVTLSVFGSAQSRAALCATGSAAAAAAGTAIAAQGSQPAPGCVLPIADTAPPPPLAESAVLPEAAPAAPAAMAAGAPNLWPLLVGLGLFSAAFFLLDDTLLDDGVEFTFPPLTPGSPT
jgi:hypothetical protein